MHAVSNCIIQTKVYRVRRDSAVNVNVIESYEFMTLQTLDVEYEITTGLSTGTMTFDLR